MKTKKKIDSWLRNHDSNPASNLDNYFNVHNLDHLNGNCIFKWHEWIYSFALQRMNISKPNSQSLANENDFVAFIFATSNSKTVTENALFKCRLIWVWVVFVWLKKTDDIGKRNCSSIMPSNRWKYKRDPPDKWIWWKAKHLHKYWRTAPSFLIRGIAWRK